MMGGKKFGAETKREYLNINSIELCGHQMSYFVYNHYDGNSHQPYEIFHQDGSYSTHR